MQTDETYFIEMMNSFNSRNCLYCLRAIYDFAFQTSEYSTQKIYMHAIQIESEYSDNASELQQIVQKALSQQQNDDKLWIYCIKTLKSESQQSINSEIINQAIQNFPENEKILLFCAQITSDNGDQKRAAELYQIAKEKLKSPKSYAKLIQFNLGQNNLEFAWLSAQEALLMFPLNDEIVLIGSQAAHRFKGLHESQQVLLKYLELYNSNFDIWKYLIRLLVNENQYDEAEDYISKSQLFINNKELEFIQLKLELFIKKQDIDILKDQINEGLDQFPHDINLLCLELIVESVQYKKKKATLLLFDFPEDPYVNFAISKIFFQLKKYEKAIKWVRKSLAIDQSIGDIWVAYYLYESKKRQGKDLEILDELKNQIFQKNLKNGLLWNFARETNFNGSIQTSENIFQRVIQLLEEEIKLMDLCQ